MWNKRSKKQTWESTSQSVGGWLTGVRSKKREGKVINMKVMKGNSDRIYFLGIQFLIFLFAYTKYIRFPYDISQMCTMHFDFIHFLVPSSTPSHSQ